MCLALQKGSVRGVWAILGAFLGQFLISGIGIAFSADVEPDQGLSLKGCCYRMYRLCKPTPVRIHRSYIPKGYPGTLSTTRYIIKLVKQGATDFCVRQKAIQIFRAYRIAPKDFLGEIAALFDWVRKNVRYTRDVFKVELLHSARRMLELKAGDCDDMVILLASMLEATGHPVRLVLVGTNPRRKDLFTHIYLETSYKGRWIALDPTMEKPMGWSPRAPHRKIVPLRQGKYRKT